MPVSDDLGNAVEVGRGAWMWVFDFVHPFKFGNMKARELKRLLNTDYIVHDLGDCIAIGSSMISELITVSKTDFKIHYALGSESDLMKKDELSQIYAKLKDFIKSGRLVSIINGKDEIENPITVYSVDNGELKEHVTDVIGWPNVTDCGELMYNNTHFQDKKKAIRYGIEDMQAAVSQMDDNIESCIRKLYELSNRKENYKLNLSLLISLIHEP